jgi:ABC-type microcin C transport system duplicated ATPase subunit YejF
MRAVKQLLSQPSEQNAEECAALLRQVEIQLGCAVAMVKASGSGPSVEIQSILEVMQGEIAVLAQFLAEADKLLSGWLRAISSRQSGYTTRGQAAPLVLLKKVSVEG